MLTAAIERVGGARLRVARLVGRAASPRSTIVLLHGYPDNLQIFGELAPRLAAAHDVVAFDWPGMGESDAWRGGATPAKMAERLAQILDHLGVERAFVAGVDMGGQPALAFAAAHPERTLGVVAMNSLVLGDAATSWEIALLRRFGVNRLVLRHLPRVVFRRAERTFFPPGVRLPDDVRADLWRAFRRSEVRAFVVRMCAAYQAALPKLPDLYARITAPTLVLWAEHDRHFPAEQARRLQALIPGSELAIVPGAEHWMIWDRAAEVAARIEAFTAGGSP